MAELNQLFLKTYNALRVDGFRNILGIDIGYKYDTATKMRLPDLAVRVHKPFGIDLIPQSGQTIDLPQDVVVVEASYMPHAANTASDPRRTKPISPLQAGVSIGTADCGTLGLICKDKTQPNNIFLLTCFHVLFSKFGRPAFQPSIVEDNGQLRDVVGSIYKTILDEGIDASTIWYNSNRGIDKRQFGTEQIITQIGKVELGQLVEKSGRTTDVRQGIVDGIGKYFIQYPVFGMREIEGFRIVPEDMNNPNNVEISAPGDSGAVWYIPDRQLNRAIGVGMNVAGEDPQFPAFPEYAIACHLPLVFEKLQLSL